MTANLSPRADRFLMVAATCCGLMAYCPATNAQQYTPLQCSQIIAQIQEYQRVLPAYEARGQGGIIRQGMQASQAAYTSGCRGGGLSATAPMPSPSAPGSRAGQYSGAGSRARDELDGMSLDEAPPPTRNLRSKSVERPATANVNSSTGLSSPDLPAQDDLLTLREKVRENTEKVRQQIEASIESYVNKDVDNSAIVTTVKHARELINLARDPQGEAWKRVDEAAKEFVADGVVGDADKDPAFAERAKGWVKERYDHIEGQLKEAKKELSHGLQNAGDNLRGFEERLKENVKAIKNIKTDLNEYLSEKLNAIKQGADNVSGK